MKNARNRARKHGTEALNTLTQSLCIPLRDIVNGYRSEWRRLHPFERVVADLTARARQKKDGLTLQDVLVSSLYCTVCYTKVCRYLARAHLYWRCFIYLFNACILE